MITVRTVDEFVRHNEEELKKFMIFKTGICDEEILKDILQEFYLKLIQSKALESFDPERATKDGNVKKLFEAYVCTLFCWLLPILARRNFRTRFNVVSTVKVRAQNRGNYWEATSDVWDFTTTRNNTRQVDFVVASNYCASHTVVDEDLATEGSLAGFAQYIRDTEPPKKAKRMIYFLQYRSQGCTSADVAAMLGLSGNMIKIIKNNMLDKYNKWSAHEGRRQVSTKKKSRTYKEVLQEIKDVQELIERSNRGDITLPSGYSHKEAVMRLQYLRVRQRQLKGKAK